MATFRAEPLRAQRFEMRTPDVERIAVKTRGKIIVIDPRELIAVTAQGNYAILHRQDGTLMVRETFSGIESKLSRCGFIRTHRSILVNKAHVNEIRLLPSGDYKLVVTGGQEFPASRTYKSSLRQVAELWIGVELFAAPIGNHRLPLPKPVEIDSDTLPLTN